MNSTIDHSKSFERTLAGCISAMFGSDLVSCVRVDAPEPTETEVVFASVGFACDGARGSVLTLGTRDVARALQPVAVEATAEEAECDVIGELTNMLVGRVKNRLLSQGVVLLLGTPLTTIARMARVLSSGAPTSSAWFGVELPAGRLFVRLDTCFEPRFEQVLSAETVEIAGTEGDMLFF